MFTDKYLADGNDNHMLVCGDKKKLYAIKGLKDYLVVDTGDVLLICPKDDTVQRLHLRPWNARATVGSPLRSLSRIPRHNARHAGKVIRSL